MEHKYKDQRSTDDKMAEQPNAAEKIANGQSTGEADGDTAVVCSTEKKLADAIKNNAEEIIIEGNLKKGVIRIKATGKVAWAACAVALTAAIGFYIASPVAVTVATPAGGGMALAAGIVTSSAATVVLGSAVVPAVLIGVFAGGIGALTALRDKYQIVEKTETSIKLKRK